MAGVCNLCVEDFMWCIVQEVLYQSIMGGIESQVTSCSIIHLNSLNEENALDTWSLCIKDKEYANYGQREKDRLSGEAES